MNTPPYNVLVNNVCPGYTATERLKKLDVHPEAQIPLGRVGTPEEFAESGGVPGIRAGQLHHRGFYSGGWGLDEGALGKSGAG